MPNTPCWPDYFPAGCPPASAVDASGSFYRLVFNDPPAPDDFIPHIKVFEGKEWPETSKAHGVSALFMACGLSIYRQSEDAERKIKRIPRLKTALIAVGELSSAVGKVIGTPANKDSHHTWWVYVDIHVHGLFKVN
jgi:hypothetical protein